MAFNDLPLASYPLSPMEKVRMVDAIDEFRRKVGAPGDYGYEARLGMILDKLYDVAGELRKQVTAKPE